MKKLFWDFISLFGTLGAGLGITFIALYVDLLFGLLVLLNLVIITVLANTYKVYRFKPRPDNPEGIRPERPFDPKQFHKFLSIKNSIAYFHYVDAGSFPSIHSARSFNQAFLFAAYLNNTHWSVLFICFAALVAWSRVVKLRHDRVDISAGAVLGLCLAGATVWLFGINGI